MKLPIDPMNPAEVLACCGIAALAAQNDELAVTGFEDDTFLSPDIDIAGLKINELNVAGINLDWWEPWGLNPKMKLWAGKQTAQSILHNLFSAAATGQNEFWLDFRGPTSSRLGVDPLGSWNALKMGWSLNEHKAIAMLCRPFVELLAFVGLQYFAVGGDRHDGFTYSLWRPVSFPVARIAFTGHGRFASSRYTSPTDKAGSNTILLAARNTI